MKVPAKFGSWAAIGAAALIAAACGSGAQTPSSSPGSPSPSGVPGSTGSPAPAVVQTPDPNVQVAWADSADTPGMNLGVPNPAGWYDAAFTGPTTEKVLYVTYDDGPWDPWTEQLLADLAAYDAKVTFFVVGTQVTQYRALVAKELAAGHAIGNHTQTHTDLNTLSAKKVKAELESVQKEGAGLIGPCMRPPYGAINAQTASVTKELGFTPVLWTGMANDWNSPPVKSMVADLKAATKPGAVILLHDGGGNRKNTVEATKQMLPYWKAEGYELMPIPACQLN